MRECPAVYFINCLSFSYSVALGGLVDKVQVDRLWVLNLVGSEMNCGQILFCTEIICLLLKEFYKLITCGIYRKYKGQRVSFTSLSELLLQYANDAHKPNDADPNLV